MRTIIYETNRLYIREMTQTDYPALAKMLQDPEVMVAYEHAFSDAETTDWLNRQLARYKEYGFGLWAVVLKDTDEMIGQCGLSLQDFIGKQVLEIGYLLQKSYWHKGYAIEAARGCKQYAFEKLNAAEVWSIIRDSNIASMNVAIRNGMTICGRFIKHAYGVDMPHYGFSVGKEASKKYNYKHSELLEAHQAMSSVINKIEKVQLKSTLGKSQQTLILRRLEAMKIASELIVREMGS
jgi:[ribosomal protein S5]-alanine N-acetyltransferase